MATIANTSWYRTGTVAVTKNNATITGTNTLWTHAGINPGATFRLDEDLTPYEILEVVSDTVITLRTPFLGTTGTGKTYSIDRNFQSPPMASLCSDVASVMHKYEDFIDAKTNTLTVTGKSAYQIACDHGFVGTEAQWVASLKGLSAYDVAVANGFEGTVTEWLESLKAAEEWTTAQESIAALDARLTDRLSALDADGTAHNAIVKRKNLGTAPTAEQMAAIRNGTFTDMYIGDYWANGSNTFTIAEFNYYRGIDNDTNPLRAKSHVVLITAGRLYKADETTGEFTVEVGARWETIPAGGYTVTPHNETIQTTGLEVVQAIFGAENLTAHRRQVINGITDHEITSYKYENVITDAVMPQQLWGYTGRSKGYDRYAEKPFALALLAPQYCYRLWGMKPLRALSTTAGNVAISYYGYESGWGPASTYNNEILMTFCLG